MFECLCFPYLRPYSSTKLEPISLPCVFLEYDITHKEFFLGYAITHKEFWCLEPSLGKIYVSAHLRFNMTVFPYLTPTTNTNMQPSSIVTDPKPSESTDVPFFVSILFNSFIFNYF